MSDDDELEIDFSEIGKKIKALFKPKKSDKKKEKGKDEEDELDMSDAINFLKENKKLLFYVGLVSIILIGAWIRTQSISHYNGLLLGLDPYAFHRYAEIIVEKGYLPEVDTLRYFPEGFLTYREHQVSSYLIAGMYTVFSPILGGRLVDYTIIYPVVSFVLSMIAFFFMIKEIFNKRTALIATAFLAFAPSYLFRTIAGFADKEALAMALWFTMIYFLVKSVKAKKPKETLTMGLLSGLFGGLSGLTWGGATFLFYSIALTFLLLALMNKLSNKNVITYYTWYIPTIVMNATLTLRYGGFSLVNQDMFMIPTLAAGLILFKIVAYKLFINRLKKKKLPDSYYFVIILIILSAITIPIIQLTGMFDFAGKVNGVIETIIHPFGTCPFCVSVTENQAPYFYDPQRGVDWWQRLQWFIPLFITGALLLVYEMFKGFKKKSLIMVVGFAIFMFFFMFSRFINDQNYSVANAFFANTYLLTLPLLGIIMVIFYVIAPKSKAWSEVTPEKILVISWFALSIIATRGAIRIVFASTPIFILLAAFSITYISKLIQDKTKDKIYSSLPYIIAILVVLWGYGITSATSGSYWPSLTNDWIRTMNWIKSNTPDDTAFTHWWDYGYWIQTMGKRATTGDGGNFDVRRNEVIGGQMFSGYNLTEVYNSLEYFKNNETGQRPDYFLILDDDVLKYVQMANIGGRPGHYSPFVYAQRIDNNIYKQEEFSTLLIFNSATGPGIISEDIILGNDLYPKDQSYVINVLIPMNDNQEFGQPLAIIYNAFTGTNTAIEYDCVCEQNVGCTHYNLNNSLQSCVEFLQGGVVHIPGHLEKRFMTQLYLLNKTIPGFELVYNTVTPLNMKGIMTQQDPTDLKIWRIDYTELEKWVDNGSPAW